MPPFVHDHRMPRVVFGAGMLQELPRELEALGARRALVLSTPGQVALADRVADLLGPHCAGVFAQAVMHVPTETAEAARAAAHRLGADSLVTVGGGSTTGLGKAIALDPESFGSLPIIAIPTTYAGSEMTTVWGLTEAGVKRTGRDPHVLPRCVFYDPELSRGLPFGITVTSMLNAIAHAAEGLYAPEANPVIELLAVEGIRRGAGALPRLQRDPLDIDARGDALVAAWLCGTVMGGITVGLHHKLCHTLGGSFKLPHAEAHCVVLPQAMAYNAGAAPQAMLRIAQALATARGGNDGATAPDQAAASEQAGASSAARALFYLAARHGAPTSLRAIGMRAEDLDRAADLAVQNAYPNPRALDRSAIRELLQRAFEGRRPD